MKAIHHRDMDDFFNVEFVISSRLWVDMEGIFSAEMARERIDFFPRCDFDLSVGLFVFEAALQDGSAPALIRQIRNADNIKDIPIVVFTATDDEEAKLACLAAGATKIFPKGAVTARRSYFLRRCSPTTAQRIVQWVKKGAEMLVDYMRWHWVPNGGAKIRIDASADGGPQAA